MPPRYSITSAPSPPVSLPSLQSRESSYLNSLTPFSSQSARLIRSRDAGFKHYILRYSQDKLVPSLMSCYQGFENTILMKIVDALHRQDLERLLAYPHILVRTSCKANLSLHATEQEVIRVCRQASLCIQLGDHMASAEHTPLGTCAVLA